jgi:uncharacterized protein YgbK (DUF1537 family)
VQSRLNTDLRRVIILDDDPTGTQTVSGAHVILRPNAQAYKAFFEGRERAVYVLTNSRAMPREEAVRYVSEIRREVIEAAQTCGEKAAFVLRGDSTLRGHVFAEIDVFASKESVSLFVPAFPEGGRITLDGIHYLVVQGEKVPVARTEFAKDTTFGYTSERLTEWAAEVGQGRTAIIVPLHRLRTEGPKAVCDALLQAPSGSVVIPDAETRADLEAVAVGLVDAEQQGRHVVVRSASSFAAIRAGLEGKEVQQLSAEQRPGRVLTVCGSHTGASSRQLERLVERIGIQPVVIPTIPLMEEGLNKLVPRITGQIIGQLQSNKAALLVTERVRLAEHGDLETGAKVMDALVAVVRNVSGYCDAVISKGGITSAQVATDGLGADAAFVCGQLEPGVSLWEIRLPDGRTIPYAVIPGNVGHDLTMADVAMKLGVKSAGV